MLEKLKQLHKKGFFSVTISSIISNLLIFFGVIFYARVLGVIEYGVYTYAFNIVSIFLLLNGLGVASGMLQFGSINPEKIDEYFIYSIKQGIKFNLIIVILINIYAGFFYPKELGRPEILMYLSAFPLIRVIIDVFQSYLRAQRRNNYLAIYVFVNSLLIFLLGMFGAFFYGILGLIVSLYVSNILSILMMLYLLKIDFRKILDESFILTIDTKIFKKYSLHSTVSNSFSQVLYLLDIFILGLILNNPIQVGLYKVATSIPFALNFIPLVIISFFYPYIASKQDNKEEVISYYKKIFYPIFIFSLIVSIMLFSYADFFILRFYGEPYLGSINSFKILSLGFVIVASFRIINGNFIAALGHSKLSMNITIVTFIFNIIVTPLLIYKFDILGASLGILFVYIFSSIVSSYFLYKMLVKK